VSETSYIGPGDKPAPYETALLLVDIQNDYFPGSSSHSLASCASSAVAISAPHCLNFIEI